MEFEKTLDANLGKSALEINSESKGYLVETAKWAKFLAIIGFVFMALIILAAFGMAMTMNQFAGELYPGAGIMIAFMYVLIGAIYFFPILYLYRFGNKMKNAVNTSNQELMTEAFANLKSHYKFFGIFMAIVIGFYILMIVIGLIFGMSSFLF